MDEGKADKANDHPRKHIDAIQKLGEDRDVLYLDVVKATKILRGERSLLNKTSSIAELPQ
ncbi:hypothetical protein VDF13_04870 [Xanthomonas campestris pv. raphani]|uniref:hypothetical protein n=1 Tax=Xanthomonas campestris TaxID=339 RepID=UPI001E2CD997|nr:hypothetical protein [Xanthomonas campestris]MCC8485866.1 hypothetical protein [Xanthomonas campestris]MEA9649514.1 hypothetical protein [Xanthomonas campestris pv. raphani]MEA9736303.1 hypothetical protein [Xanthomonas campestris pv. raphani]MEA9743016.1 hypothetical protein [Xanthomonas campestris pv. raphani]MEA9766704.1 hypothetical protein [Xanthomonas campestris pv. raphani]